MARDRNAASDRAEYEAWVRDWLDDDALRDWSRGALDPLFVAGAIIAYLPLPRPFYAQIVHALHDLQDQRDFTADVVVDWMTRHFERDGTRIAPIVLQPTRRAR